MNKIIVLSSLVFVGGCLDDAVQSQTVDAGSDVAVADQSADIINTPVLLCDPDTQICCNPTSECGSGVCDLASNTCIQCSVSADCETGQICKIEPDVVTNECVQCTNKNHCMSANASKCDENSCVECVEAADCAHLPGNLRGCDDGVCVGCANDDECSDSFACDVTTKTCSTTIKVDKQEACFPCVSTSSCKDGFACIPMGFAEVAHHGNFCMPLPPAQGCRNPFGMGTLNRESVEGVSVDVCMLDESLTTCEAILQFNTRCTLGGGECDAAGSSCKSDASTNLVCSYMCKGVEDCKDGATCPVSTEARFCRP